jgi:hypothetical protein
MLSKEKLTGYMEQAFLYNKPIDIVWIQIEDGEPPRCWFALRQVAEVLKFKCNFSIFTTRTGSIIHIVDRKLSQTFVEIGLIQLLVYAHPAGNIDEDTKKMAIWNLYDHSPLMNGFSKYQRDHQVQFEYCGKGVFDFEVKGRTNKTVSYLTY